MKRRTASFAAVLASVLAFMVGVMAPPAQGVGSSMTWAAPRLVDPLRSGHGELECTSPTFCMATDANASAWYSYDGTGWGPLHHQVVGSPGHPLTCTSPTFCLGIAGYRDLFSTSSTTYRFDGTDWKPGPDVSGGGPVALSCGSPSLCALIDQDGFVNTFSTADYKTTSTFFPNGSTFGIEQVSCAGSTFCLAVGGGSSWTFDGTTWSAATTIGTRSTYRSLSCASATLCAALDGQGHLDTWNGTTWASTQVAAPGNTAFGNVSCAAGFCMATDGAFGVHTFHGTTWATAAQPAASAHAEGYGDLSCVSATWCMTGVGSGVSTIFNGTTWSAPVTFNPPAAGIVAVSCPSVYFCAGLDYRGPVTFGLHGSHDWPRQGFAAPLVGGDISCPSSSFCMSVAGAQWTRYDGASWSRPATLGTRYWLAVSCPSSTFCAAVNSKGEAATWNGTSWSVPKKVISYGGDGVSCPTVGYCLATNSNHAEVVFSGGRWHTYASIPLHIDRVSCVSAAWCAGISGANVAIRRNGVWGAAKPVATRGLRDLDCVTTAFCAAMSSSGSNNVYIFDGSAWTRTHTGLPHDGPAPDISCPTIHHCTATDSQYASSGVR